jgi:uncharacterized protein (DUF4415 family)
MKHRSVIAYIIVAAALFSLPQLSHDLRALKGAVGARLHSELLHAFLSLPAGDPVAAAPVARPSETLLASCTQAEKSGAAAAKSVKVVGKARAGERTFEQSAMIGDPAHDPINQKASAELEKAADVVVAALPGVKVEAAEVAMIVPPETGLDPRTLADTLVSADVARGGAERRRVEADGLRVAYSAAARFDANGPEWQKATADILRQFDGSLPGAYEFRVVRDGAKAKVLKLKCGECPAAAPRLTRLLPRQAAVNLPLPAPLAPVSPAESASE